MLSRRRESSGDKTSIERNRIGSHNIDQEKRRIILNCSRLEYYIRLLPFISLVTQEESVKKEKSLKYSTKKHLLPFICQSNNSRSTTTRQEKVVIAGGKSLLTTIKSFSHRLLWREVCRYQDNFSIISFFFLFVSYPTLHSLFSSLGFNGFA